MNSLAQDPENAQHIPVLFDEVIEGLQLFAGAVIIDGTLGGGGHTSAILEQIGPTGRLLAIDADPAAIRRVSKRLAHPIETGQLTLHHGSFEDLAEAAAANGFNHVDGILFDFGLSSFQLETAERGFSFRQSGPLDMRFDLEQTLDAHEIVNRWPEDEIADILYIYGEEKRSRHIARRIVQGRPIQTTDELALVVEKAVGGRRKAKIHPATRTFQALRIAVNRELAQIEAVLPQSLTLLKPAGRLVVISFHSLEDRIVKQWMRAEALTYVQDPTTILGGYERQADIKLITRKPITPSASETERNPRSRSAKLRIAEKIKTKK